MIQSMPKPSAIESRPLRVLLAHNYYQQAGGEDRVFAAETELLLRHGHQVIVHTTHNDLVPKIFPVSIALKTVWNGASYQQFQALLRRERPDLVHFHNTFPLISPAAYYAAAAEGVPVVQTLHNYRLLCPSATLFRDGHVCDECVHRTFAWPALRHGCYRGSRTATGAVAAMLSIHREAGTWMDSVDKYICLTESARLQFIEGGLPPHKLVVKPNFVTVPNTPGNGCGDFVLFAGRLTAEKGVATLLEAWRAMDAHCRLKIAGDGPLANEVKAFAQSHESAEWLGQLSAGEIRALLRQAKAVIVPSEWVEPFGLIAIEALAQGTPVIASRIGGLAEVVDHGRTGLLFKPRDPHDLADQIIWVYDHPQELSGMRGAAHAEACRKYDPESNYSQLISIYQRVAGPHYPTELPPNDIRAEVRITSR
jgi:glycosyltransferase involved in cell wall biosynthesis